MKSWSQCCNGAGLYCRRHCLSLGLCYHPRHVVDVAEGKMEVSDEKQEVNEAMNSVPSTVNFYMPHVEQYPVGPKLRVGLIVAVQPNEQQKKRTEEFWLAKFVMWKIEHDAVTNQKKVLFKVAWLENNGKGTYRPAKTHDATVHTGEQELFDLIPITKAPGNLSDAEEDDCAERASDDEAEQKYFADLVA
eukprot:TRINITY_DN1075_c0_g1_i4.p1 TRINITY_DN1075_c0_g1~~TRINITY_DN1075_c0_g1_i4.p1  ORF type:complete len:190 (-),score=21.62 TRINITY_DN1075_c0_g1_i4:104-673(-)